MYILSYILSFANTIGHKICCKSLVTDLFNTKYELPEIEIKIQDAPKPRHLTVFIGITCSKFCLINRMAADSAKLGQVQRHPCL